MAMGWSTARHRDEEMVWVTKEEFSMGYREYRHWQIYERYYGDASWFTAGP